MAEVQLLRVLAVSSEDPQHPARNLLHPDAGGRWMGAKGETQISVELELPPGQRLQRLLIGNNGSAFVEALVGTQGGDGFQVLLPTAAFMTPRESRQGAEPRRGRSFGPEALVKGTLGGGWDRLRLVCTQPYSQERPFGLSYVRLFAPSEDAAPAETKVRRLGPFTLREGGGPLPPAPPRGPLLPAPPLPHSPPQGPSPWPHVCRCRPQGQRWLRPQASAPQAPPLPSPPPTPSTTNGTPRKKPRPSPPQATPPPSEATPPPDAILAGVVVALSGYQNPLRGQLRAAAVAMGAEYSPDWTPRCTHLVSAFPRTPKAARARAMGGVVVSPDWIWDCRRRGQRLPCRTYLLDGSASSGSEGEEPDEATPPPDPAPHVTTGSDSGDESDQSEPDDPYGGSTEENSEEEEEEEEPIPPLPDFFRGLSFLLAGSFPEGEGRQLRRLVIAFGGTLAPSMNASVTHVVTAQGWDETFDQALELRPSLTIVRPHWLLRCGEQLRPLPAQPYAVVPTDV
ncbi:DNA repair protein XRCC1 [Melopsittacus undulatus]|uniref:DNA repair protein XRCC1 n=1 Tax=Melopsittacus undulatus TaxID=13146 RepID=UPI00146AA258|nr:DNA repair protein XRCC1 [Melopsittacus undulatus]